MIKQQNVIVQYIILTSYDNINTGVDQFLVQFEYYHQRHSSKHWPKPQ